LAGRINDDDIQALRERADIAAVVGEYTALKRAGTKLKGLCPFHNEKTPSFTVDPVKNLHHCFGCGEGGDIYAFLMRVEALSFPEAVERLARIEGYTLRYEELSPGQRKALGRRTRLLEALAEAQAFYAAELRDAGGQGARDYLAGRGVDADALAQFALGWAPDRWDGLVRHLTGKGFDQRELIDAGLVSQGRRGALDRFRGRIVFPIYDRSGRDVVAFGGRVLPGVEPVTWAGDGDPPKYINSSETEVYRKAEVLYGLNWARAEIQRTEVALVVEGYMDVIALHLAGVTNVVATCGTALTAEHFRQLEKLGRKVVLALDADDAGFAAADRARALAAEAGVRDVGVLPLPADEDPADLAAAGREAVMTALKAVKTALEFQIEHLMRGADTSTPEGQVEAYQRTFPLLARLDNRFLRFTYIRDIVAPAVRLSADVIERDLDERLARGAVPDEPDLPRPSHSAGASVARLGGVEPTAPRSPQLVLEREVLRAALQHADLLPPAWADVTAEDFTAPASRTLFEAIRGAPAGDVSAVLAALPDDDTRSRVRALALSEETVQPDEAHIAELIARLRAASAQREVTGVRAELERVNADTDPEQKRLLFSRLLELEQRRRRLLQDAGG
jgi:DNA primase